MSTAAKTPGNDNEQAQATNGTSGSTASGEDTPAISPAERWLKIREGAYLRAQKRGFVGGNPYKDWLDSQAEVDAEYTTDYRGVFSLSDPEEVVKQIRSVLAGYGLSHLSVDSLLKKHRESMERLADFNSKFVGGSSELARQQTALVQDAMSEAVNTLRAVTRGKISSEGVTKQVELSMKAMENTMSLVRSLTEAVTGTSPKPGDDDSTKQK